MKVISNIFKKVEMRLSGDSSGHGMDHTSRVYKNSLEIAKKTENVDMFIIEVSALLHDVADHKFGYNDNDRKNIITEILLEENLDIIFIEKIVSIVNNISFSKGNIPESIEGKIVQDADRIDALGAIGIARTFAYGGSKNRPFEDSIQHFYDKLLTLKDTMNTAEGKKIAKERTEFMEEFLKLITEELG
ncbi:MAG: HD domain-containing protein [Fusobacteriaceae bacterium]